MKRIEERAERKENEGEEEGEKEKERKKGSSINCPALCGKLRFNSRIQGGAAGKGARLPAGGARIHAVHDPHAFYMVTTWRRIASCCVKSGREAATPGKRPLIINGNVATTLSLKPLTFITAIRQAEKEDTLKMRAAAFQRTSERANELAFIPAKAGLPRAGLKVPPRESR